MKSTTVFGMTALVLVAILVLLMMNFAPKATTLFTSTDTKQPFFPANDIRGMAVEHKGLLYTLNYDQQRLAADAILRSVEVKEKNYMVKKETTPFDKIIIYRFNASDVEIYPIQLKESNWIFSIPQVDSKMYYLELSGGELNTMLNHSFDP